MRKILRVDYTLHEVKPLRHDLIAVVHDEHTTDVKFDGVVLLLSAFEHIEWGSLWNKKKGSELKLTFDGEMLDGKVFLPVVRKGLVEGSVLFISNILRGTHPQWFLLVKMRPRLSDMLDFLGLLFLFLSLFIDILIFFFFLVIRDFLLFLLLNLELDRETNEFRMLFDKILKTTFLKIFLHIFRQVKDNSGSTSKWFVSARLDGKD